VVGEDNVLEAVQEAREELDERPAEAGDVAELQPVQEEGCLRPGSWTGWYDGKLAGCVVAEVVDLARDEVHDVRLWEVQDVTPSEEGGCIQEPESVREHTTVVVPCSCPNHFAVAVAPDDLVLQQQQQSDVYEHHRFDFGQALDSCLASCRDYWER
jgi:hypothetical protein